MKNNKWNKLKECVITWEKTDNTLSTEWIGYSHKYNDSHFQILLHTKHKRNILTVYTQVVAFLKMLTCISYIIRSKQYMSL